MTPIIKVVGDFCNLKCAYCFYNQRDQFVRHVMGRDLLEKFIKGYLELFSENSTFIWHGGEPLLAGIDFFADAIRFQKQYCRSGSTVRNTIQMNATLVNDEWADFFAANEFGVGVSLDGDRESHDRFRTTETGRGSFDRVMLGVDILQRHGLKPGFIQTLTYANLPRAAQDFSFFAALPGGGSNWGVNAFFGFDSVDELNDAMREQRVTPPEFTAFLRQSIDAWLEADDPRIRIREIENFLAGVVGKRARNCTFNGTCSWYFCLEYDGRVYPCDRLSGRADLLLGDLSRESLRDILGGGRRHAYAERVNSIHPDCVQCEWHAACHNGCTHHRVDGIDGKYYYCETRKETFGYLRDRMKALQLLTAVAEERGGEENVRAGVDARSESSNEGSLSLAGCAPAVGGGAE